MLTSLIELILLVVILSASVAVSLQSIPGGESPREQRACNLARQKLQSLADGYFSESGRWPSRDLSELTTREGTDKTMRCPCGHALYQMSGAIVMCPQHEPTRQK